MRRRRCGTVWIAAAAVDFRSISTRPIAATDAFAATLAEPDGEGIYRAH